MYGSVPAMAMASLESSRTRFVLPVLMVICTYAVVTSGYERPFPNADQSRFAVCGLAAGRAFTKHDDDSEDEDPAVDLDTGRIVGGREAKQNELHYIVSVQVGPRGGTGSSFRHMCGGAIYSAKWIITAAHCFSYDKYQPRFDDYQIIAGEHVLDVPEDGEQAILIKRIIEHPFYSPSSQHNDITLLELEKPITFNKNIRPIKLPACEYVPKGRGTIGGWGRMIPAEIGDTSARFATSLQVAEVDIYSQRQCTQVIGEGLDDEDYALHENAFCAGKMEGGIDSCSGDSGGPLVCHDKDGDVLCGIVSIGYGCALKNLPGVYTYVPHFRDWIVHVTSGE